MESNVTHNIVDDKPSLPPKYVKILRESMQHHHFKYKLGLNTDHIPFNPSGSCEPGGLYFTDINNFYTFLQYGTLIADVVIPEGVEIYADPECIKGRPYKWKAPSIIISNIRLINDLPQWNDYAFWLSIVQENGCDLYHVPNKLKTVEMCLSAVQQNGGALAYVPDELKTKEMCLVAVRQDGNTLRYVPEKLKTEEICLIAVQQDGCALGYVPVILKTVEMCLVAVRQTGLALAYVRDKLKTEEICLAAVRQNGLALGDVPKKLKTEEICLAAVQQNREALMYVPESMMHKCKL